jgi:hypothetical protein
MNNDLERDGKTGSNRPMVLSLEDDDWIVSFFATKPIIFDMA